MDLEISCADAGGEAALLTGVEGCKLQPQVVDEPVCLVLAPEEMLAYGAHCGAEQLQQRQQHPLVPVPLLGILQQTRLQSVSE